jgi:thymidylate synthase
LSVTIRSNDMYAAWPANVYAVAELLAEVSKRTEIAMGTVTTFSVNAHIYSHDWPKASQV